MAKKIQTFASLDEIRLACMNCDRDDMDGILDLALAVDWQDIHECDFLSHTSEWWTHLGWCHDCARAANEVNPHNFPNLPVA